MAIPTFVYTSRRNNVLKNAQTQLNKERHLQGMTNVPFVVPTLGLLPMNLELKLAHSKELFGCADLHFQQLNNNLLL